jgi:hypothetical protein
MAILPRRFWVTNLDKCCPIALTVPSHPPAASSIDLLGACYYPVCALILRSMKAMAYHNNQRKLGRSPRCAFHAHTTHKRKQEYQAITGRQNAIPYCTMKAERKRRRMGRRSSQTAFSTVQVSRRGAHNRRKAGGPVRRVSDLRTGWRCCQSNANPSLVDALILKSRNAYATRFCHSARAAERRVLYS